MPYLELLDNNLSKLLIADIVGGERGPLKTAYGLGLIISSRKNLIKKKYFNNKSTFLPKRIRF